ncbi:ArsR/SmtB family transcription factor [Roseixanthobacter liquoris]|uniref:ArsR/SmtB family transcription factor n=1 Tax=Roseixanthobacter liquoris TaxID=3119921 RepID=UPI00372A2BC7
MDTKDHPKLPLACLEERAAEAAELLTSMANSKRLIVLCHLSESERSVGELAVITGLSSSAVSQHLGKLRLQGLVKTRRDAQSIFYSISSNKVRMLLETLSCLYHTEPGDR